MEFLNDGMYMALFVGLLLASQKQKLYVFLKYSCRRYNIQGLGGSLSHVKQQVLAIGTN